MAKEKAIQITTPKGILKFPRVTGDADFRFDKERGDYSTKLLLDPSDAKVQEFMARLDKLTDEAVAKVKADNPKDAKKVLRGEPYTMEVDKEGNETGKVEVKFGMKHKITAKKGEHAGKVFLKVPTLFDNMGKPMDQKTAKVGGGSVARISFEIAPEPYFVASSKQAGLTKRLLALQILVLKEWGERAASDYGFEADDEDSSIGPDSSIAALSGGNASEEETDNTGGDF